MAAAGPEAGAGAALLVEGMLVGLGRFAFAGEGFFLGFLSVFSAGLVFVAGAAAPFTGAVTSALTLTSPPLAAAAFSCFSRRRL